MFGVGAGCASVVAGAWRAPPLALSEFSTSLGELLQPHSLAGVRAMLAPGDLAASALAEAARAQALRSHALLLSLRHNQVLLDHIVRKLDRRRRVLAWRAAAMEGATGAGRPDQKPLDQALRIGGPPGHYAPAADTSGPVATSKNIHEYLEPLLLRDPPMPQQPPARLRTAGDEGTSVVGMAGGGAGRPHGWLDAKAYADLRTCRRRLVDAASELWLDVSAVKLALRDDARRRFVRSVRSVHAERISGSGAAAGAEASALAAEGSFATSSSMGLGLKLEGCRAYVEGFLAALLPAACKLDLAACARELALALLGSTGGLGAEWGVKVSPDGKRTLLKPEPTPLFTGAEGADRLHKLMLEYGPLWQPVNFELADKSGDPDPMTWAPAVAAIPTGFMFPDLNGNARLDTLWHVPAQWDVLASNCYSSSSSSSSAAAAAAASSSSPAGLAPAPGAGPAGTKGGTGHADALSAGAASGDGSVELMEDGVRLGRALLGLIRAALFEAALLAPGLGLARGGDLTRPLLDKARGMLGGVPAHALGPDLVTHRPPSLAGPALYRHVATAATAATLPLLPGALLAPSLVTLHARMQFVTAHKPAGYAAKAAAQAQAAAGVSGQRAVPMSDAVAYMRRELRLHTLTQLVAICRARDAMAAVSSSSSSSSPLGPSSWHLAGALEHAVAVGAARPELRLSLLESAALRMRPAERLALHNELARLGLLLDRCISDCLKASASTRPVPTQAVAEHVLAGAWAHDRLRDALGWRTMLMERPELYPFAPPQEAHFLRRYHAPKPRLDAAAGATLPPPAPVRAFLEHHFSDAVAAPAEALLRQAAALPAAKAAAGAPQGSSAVAPPDEEESQLVKPAGGGATAPGKPGWLVQSPAWGSPEARAIEAATVVMKQLLDLQAVQVALLKLNQDVGEMAGLAAAAASPPPPSSSLFITQSTPFSTALSPYSGQAAMSAPGTPVATAVSLRLQQQQQQQQQQLVNGAAVGGGGREPSARLAAAVAAPAVQALVRKLAATRRRAPDGNPSSATFEISLDDLSRWLADAAATLSAEARAALTALGGAAAAERAALHGLVEGLQEQMQGLGRDLDVFMRRQAIKVDTQVVDKAMSLLNELHQARRAAARSLEDARHALEVAYLEAQKQYGAKIDELKNALLVAHTNAVAMQADMVKGALEALLEVRREALTKAFGVGVGGSKGGMGSEITRMLELEGQLEAVQSEVLDLQRAMVKVQTWFKMRSSAFQTACMREVIRARDQAQAMEAAMWEQREASELVHEQLASQLAATQADLEVASAALAKSDADLHHARSSNKRLMAWKVSELPRAEALKVQLEEVRRGRTAVAEQQQRAAAERARLAAAQAAALPRTPTYSLRASADALMLRSSSGGGLGSAAGRSPSRRIGGTASPHGSNGGGGASSPQAGGRKASASPPWQHGQPQPAGAPEGAVAPEEEAGADAGGEEGACEGPAAAATGVLRRAWEAQRAEYVQQIEALKRQVQEERQAKNEVFERFMLGRPASAGVWLPGVSAPVGPLAVVGTAPPPAAPGPGAGPVTGPTPTASQQQSVALLSALHERRHAELQRAHDAAAAERDGLRAALTALRFAAPELVQAVTGSMGAGSGGSGTPATGSEHQVQQGPGSPLGSSAARPSSAARSGHGAGGPGSPGSTSPLRASSYRLASTTLGGLTGSRMGVAAPGGAGAAGGVPSPRLQAGNKEEGEQGATVAAAADRHAGAEDPAASCSGPAAAAPATAAPRRSSNSRPTSARPSSARPKAAAAAPQAAQASSLPDVPAPAAAADEGGAAASASPPAAAAAAASEPMVATTAGQVPLNGDRPTVSVADPTYTASATE